MVALKLGHSTIHRNGNKVYFIAEIGQNHQGSLETAKTMIIQAKKSGCDCVKFQKSCLKSKFTKAALCRQYDTIHSWGKTYGEHKSFLEFSIYQYRELQEFCKKIEMDFTASAMDEISLKQLDALNVPFIKIGSGDANNFPLLEKAAQLRRPLVISTGMQTTETIDYIIQIMEKAKKSDYALMHCVSSYPTEPENCQLSKIRWLRQKYPNLVIGYSGHELGLDISKAAALFGARIIERHFTLDKEQKGSDHRCSLEPSEMAQLVVSVKSLMSNFQPNEELPNHKIIKILGWSLALEESTKLCSEERVILPCEMNCFSKLGKSLVSSKSLKAGHIICLNDVCVKVSEPNGIPADRIYNVVGSKLLSDLESDQPFLFENLYFRN